MMKESQSQIDAGSLFHRVRVCQVRTISYSLLCDIFKIPDVVDLVL